MSDRSDDPRFSLAERLVDGVLSPMKARFVGKDDAIDLLGVALVGRENIFLYGPPGTAKSAVINELGRRLDGRVFDYLLTRFTEPNELFGPFDIRRLRDGDLVTNTEGMLPEADLVFLDELLNANSAILNALLLALNERIFRRGRETRPLPTLMIAAAGNTLPEDETLGALFDRFLIRVNVDNVDGERLGDVLDAGWRMEQADGSDDHAIGVDEVRQVQSLVAEVDVASVRPVYQDAIAAMRRAGLAVSDRRAVRYQRLLAASAILCGRNRAQPSDLWVLRTTWDRVEQQAVLASLVDELITAHASDDDGRDHPQARVGAAPDPESLARDLETLRQSLAEAEPERRLQVRDRLASLAGRVQWVSPGPQRDALEKTVHELWTALA